MATDHQAEKGPIDRWVRNGEVRDESQLGPILQLAAIERHQLFLLESGREISVAESEQVAHLTAQELPGIVLPPVDAILKNDLILDSSSV